MKVYFGVDIGGTFIKYGAFTEEDTLLKKWSVPTDISESGRRIIPGIVKEIKDFISENSTQEYLIAGIGVGVPGPVANDGHVRNCVNLNWYDFNPVEELKRFFPGIKIAAENDANSAALGEYYFGKGKEYSSMMLITLGTGVGGGIVINGQILPSAHGIAGEIGHIALDSNEIEKCSCGNKGCLNQISSATGIVRIMKRFMQNSNEDCLLREKSDFTSKDVCDAVIEGDCLAKQCVDYCMGLLGKGLAYFSHAFDPEIFVICGGVANAGDYIVESILHGYNKEMFLIDKGADIVVSDLRGDAGMLGAYALVRYTSNNF